MGTTIQIITIIALLLSPTFGADTSIEIPISPSPVGLPLIDITATPSSYSTLSSIFDTPYLFNYLPELKIPSRSVVSSNTVNLDSGDPSVVSSNTTNLSIPGSYNVNTTTTNLSIPGSYNVNGNTTNLSLLDPSKIGTNISPLDIPLYYNVNTTTNTIISKIGIVSTSIPQLIVSSIHYVANPNLAIKYTAFMAKWYMWDPPSGWFLIDLKNRTIQADSDGNIEERDKLFAIYKVWADKYLTPGQPYYNQQAE